MIFIVGLVNGYGGAILASDKTVVINSPEALQALNEMVSWIGTISSPDVLTFKEVDAYLIWLNGEVSVMRNWPGLTASSNDKNVSQISGKFMIHPLLYGGSNTVGHSCVGGWQLGINAFSKNQAAAWEFIQ